MNLTSELGHGPRFNAFSAKATCLDAAPAADKHAWMLKCSRLSQPLGPACAVVIRLISILCFSMPMECCARLPPVIETYLVSTS